MPTRRKNQATTAAATTGLGAAGNGHSAALSKRTGLGPEGAAGKMSRLAPSVPFQMTTRRSAKGTSNHATSAGSSSVSSASRRSSLDAVAQENDEAPSDHEEARPAKRSRTSTDSGSPPVSNNASFDSNTPMQAPQSPLPLPSPQPRKSAAAAAAAVDDDDAPLIESKPAGKKRRASDGATPSSKAPTAAPTGLLTRTHSNASEPLQPRRKKRKTTGTPAEIADQPPELTDASTAPNSPEQIPDVDSSQTLQNVLPTNGEAPAKSGRRLPGRRRQPHPDINIETDLRRQLNLKMSYRSLAKAQKLILDELSNRTTRSLEKDLDYHTKCPEYEALMAELNQRRDSRLDEINAMRTFRLDELERIRIAEERIQNEQYINRFQELQDDFLLQCYFRMKQIEREMKGEQANATDDEDNVLPPTYTDEPHCEADDRIKSKYASRSRAYVEADRELERESIRRRFNLARASFVQADADADDSLGDVAGGFARYAGPDRMIAVAHFNIASLADAALAIEKSPSPTSNTQDTPILPNEQATLLMMLADLSSQHTPLANVQASPLATQSIEHSPHIEPRDRTPEVKQELTKQPSPRLTPTEIPLVMPSQAAHTTTIKLVHPEGSDVNQSDTSQVGQEPEKPKKATPPRVSTHRIMDMLNDDREVPVSKLRELQSSTRESAPKPRNENEFIHYRAISPRIEPPPIDHTVSREEPPVDQALMDALGGPPQPNHPPCSSPSHHTLPWPTPGVEPSREPEESLRRRDPIQRIREMLDRKARENGRDPPDRPQPWRGPAVSEMPGSQGGHDRPDMAAYDPQQPTASLYDVSPRTVPAHPSATRRESQDQISLHWERDRRTSGSQASQQPAASSYLSASVPHGHQGEHHHQAPTPPTHQSPYALPSNGVSLPPKPPGPPPAGPINFRFAHYDPAPARQSYPPPSPSYPPASHSGHGPTHQYPSIYGTTSHQGNYVAPIASFPPPPPSNSVSSYPPLKIHQYGGQPILPANMAPPPQSGAPMTFTGQPAPPPAFSPPQGQHPSPHYTQREAHGERLPEPQSRPRRPYRSYHAPGTQFRSYQGPGDNRRRGG